MAENPLGANEDVQVAISADDQATGVIDNVIQSFDSLKGAAGVAGGAIAALGVKMGVDAVNAAASFEDAILDLQKVAGEDVAAGLRDTIQEMSEEIPLTAEELAGLATEAARFGIESEENIQRFVENTAQMATATTLNTDEAAEAFAKLSELTGTPISEIENLGSSINTLSNNFATSSQEIVDAALRSAGALSDLGLEQTEIFGLTAAINEVSESSERAGTRLRRLAQELMDADPEALAEPLGLTVEQFEQLREEDPRDLIAQMAETMGEGGEAADALREELSTTSRQALSGLSQNLEGVTDANETANQAFEEGTSIQSEFSQELDKTTTQQELLRSQIQNVKRDLGEELLPAFNSTIDLVSSGVERFSDLNSATGGAAAKFGLLGTVLGGAALAIGAVVSLLSGPVLLAIGGVSAAVAGLAAAWQSNFLGIQDVTEAYFGVVQDVLGAVAAFLEDDVLPLVVEFVETSIDRFEAFADFAEDALGDDVKDVLQELGPAFRNVARIIRRAIDRVQRFLEPALRAVRRMFERNSEEIQTIVDAVMTVVQTIFITAGRNILDAVEAFLLVLQGDFDGAGNRIEAIVGRSFGAVETIIGSTLTAIEQLVNIGLNNIEAEFGVSMGGVRTLVSGAFDNLETIIDTSLANIKAAVALGLAVLRGDFDEAGARFEDIIGRSFDAILSIAETSFQTLDTLTGGRLSDVQARFEGLAQWLRSTWDFVNSLLSPVREAVQMLIGNSIIPDAISDIKAALTDLTGWLSATWSIYQKLTSPVRDAATDIVSSILTDLFSSTANRLKRLSKWVAEVWGFDDDMVLRVQQATSQSLAVLNGFRSSSKDELDGLATYIDERWPIRTNLVGVLSDARDDGTSVTDAFASRAEDDFENLTAFLSAGWMFGDTLLSTLSSVFDEVTASGSGLLWSFIGDVQDGLHNIVDFVDGLWLDRLTSAFTQAWDAVIEVFDSVSLPSIGWPSPPGWLMEIARDIGGTILDALERISEMDFPDFGDGGDGSDGGDGDDGDDGDDGNRGGGCFAGHEPVRTPSGDRSIADIDVGDEVVSYDTDAGEWTISTVADTTVHDVGDHPWGDAPLLALIARVNGSIRTTAVTANHPYYLPDRDEWRSVADIDAGETIRSPDGDAEVIAMVVLCKDRSEAPPIYNIEMADEDPPNFCVRGQLVHNPSKESMPGMLSSGLVDSGGAATGGLDGEVTVSADVDIADGEIVAELRALRQAVESDPVAVSEGDVVSALETIFDRRGSTL